jgi:hypothetical protein
MGEHPISMVIARNRIVANHPIPAFKLTRYQTDALLAPAQKPAQRDSRFGD